MERETATPGSGQRSGQVAKERASEAAGQAKASAGEVASTAQEQARGVVDESRTQIQHMTAEMRDRLGEETHTQTQRASETLRHWSDDLESMAENADSPMGGVVRRVAESGRGAADFLDERGIGGVAEEMRTFARRRPGIFLAGAVLAGFAVGRLAKAVKQESMGGSGQALSGNSFRQEQSMSEALSTPRPRQEGMPGPGNPAMSETRQEPGAQYDAPSHGSTHDQPR